MVKSPKLAYSNALVFMPWNKAAYPHADFIRAIKIALQRWGIDSGEPRRHVFEDRP